MKFELSGKELETFKKWDKEHKKTCEVIHRATTGEFMDAVGYRLEFIFSPTGLGDGITVKCACGEKCNCTDIDSW